MNISLKKTIGAALTALLLTTGTGAAAPFTPHGEGDRAQIPHRIPTPPEVFDAEAQLDVMAASGVIQEKINDMYHTWDAILKSGMAERSMYHFYAVVTDLDWDGRLELLISSHFLNKDPLYYAGDDISEEDRQAYKYLSDTFLSRTYGTVYEISEDHTSLEPIPQIFCGGNAFPDFTRIYIRSHYTDGLHNYNVDTNLMPRDDTMTSGTDRYGIVREEQFIWLDLDVGVGTMARLEGTAGISDGIAVPHYTSMYLLGTHQTIDPYGEEAAEFERKYRDRGRRVNYVSWEELNRDARTALASSWYGWTYEYE